MNFRFKVGDWVYPIQNASHQPGTNYVHKEPYQITALSTDYDDEYYLEGYGWEWCICESYEKAKDIADRWNEEGL